MESDASSQRPAANQLNGFSTASILDLPATLLDLLSNDLLLSYILPYLPLGSINALIRTSPDIHNILSGNELTFRLVDLSASRSAYLPPSLSGPIDSGGFSWRSQRMDENLTEDEFYSGPLRGIMSKLKRFGILRNVQTLVLDGLASVTADFVHEVCCTPGYNVRILSVIGCPNLNQRILQGMLCYLARPSRPAGEPRLKGLYIFGAGSTAEIAGRYPKGGVPLLRGITRAEGATLGSAPVETLSENKWGNDMDFWFAPTGKMLSEGHSQRSSWEETLLVCKGIIAFDALLCTHMHQDMGPYLNEASKDYLSQHKPGIPPIATVALGPEGCAGCGKAPSGSPVWGKSDMMEFPLLRPAPFSGKVLDAVTPPELRGMQRRLITSCSWCLANRHCDMCHRWWCGDCYDPRGRSAKLKDLERLTAAGLDYLPSRQELGFTMGNSSKSGGGGIKVFNNLCVENCLVGTMMAGAGSGGMWG